MELLINSVDSERNLTCLDVAITQEFEILSVRKPEEKVETSL